MNTALLCNTYYIENELLDFQILTKIQPSK